jgi:hypothetical protein
VTQHWLGENSGGILAATLNDRFNELRILRMNRSTETQKGHQPLDAIAPEKEIILRGHNEVRSPSHSLVVCADMRPQARWID